MTTLGGLTPIILETSSQTRQIIPMTIPLGFGIVFATAIILVIVPCLYMILDDVGAKVAKVLGRRIRGTYRPLRKIPMGKALRSLASTAVPNTSRKCSTYCASSS